MSRSRFLIVFGWIFVALFAGTVYYPVLAVKASSWAADERVPGYLDDTFTPFLVADSNRTVHAFASQSVDRSGFLAIVYRQWTLRGGWTRPVDIILSPLGGNANILGVYLDSNDVIHVIFSAIESFTNKTSIYYSSAMASEAELVPAWSLPVLIGEDALILNSAAIVGDNQGNLAVIYSGNHDGNGVYSVYSKDAGRSWSDIQTVYLTNDTNLSAFSLRLIDGPDQTIRAAWNVVTGLGEDEALLYADFDSNTYAWNPPLELDKRIDLPLYFGPSFPVMVDNGREIIVMYNSGNPFSDRPVDPGRPVQRVRLSSDRGRTWNEPASPFPFHVGRSGEHAMTLDGDGNPHVLFVQRIETIKDDGKYSIVAGIWHSVFRNGVWSVPDLLNTTVAPHDVRAIVSQGNILLVVWREDPGAGESGVWFSYETLDIPESPVKPLATPSDVIAQISSPTQISTVTSTPPTPFPDFLDQAPPSNVGRNPAFSILVGLVPVALILIGVIIGYRFLSRSNG